MATIYAVDDPNEKQVWLSLDGNSFLPFNCDPQDESDVEIIRNAFHPQEKKKGDDGQMYSILPMTVGKRGLSLLLKLDVGKMRTLEI